MHGVKTLTPVRWHPNHFLENPMVAFHVYDAGAGSVSKNTE